MIDVIDRTKVFFYQHLLKTYLTNLVDSSINDGVDKKSLAVVCRWPVDRADGAITIDIWQ